VRYLTTLSIANVIWRRCYMNERTWNVRGVTLREMKRNAWRQICSHDLVHIFSVGIVTILRNEQPKNPLSIPGRG